MCHQIYLDFLTHVKYRTVSAEIEQFINHCIQVLLDKTKTIYIIPILKICENLITLLFSIKYRMMNYKCVDV